MGKASRDKGARFERDLVNIMKSGGIDAVRVPLSGMGHEKDGGEFAGDLVVPMFGAREKFEAKKRGEATGFALIYRWLGKHRGLFIGADRKETLVVIRLSDFVAMCKETNQP